MTEAQETPNPEALSPLEKSIETVRISDKLVLSVLPIDHITPLDTEIIQRLANSSDGAILEYAPQELNELKGNPLLETQQKSYHQRLENFFTPIQQAFFAQGKDIYSVDPAHDLNFGIFRTTAPIAGLGAGTAVATKVYELLKKIQGEQIPRRSALKRLTFGGLALFGLGGSYELSQIGSVTADMNSGEPNNFRLESNFRRAVIPEAIKQLGEKMSQEATQEQTLLLVYPPVHWKAIKPKLKDPNNRAEFDKWHSIFSPIQQFEESFFTIRRYHPTPSGITREPIKMK